jgi:hypothetical protein
LFSSSVDSYFVLSWDRSVEEFIHVLEVTLKCFDDFLILRARMPSILSVLLLSYQILYLECSQLQSVFEEKRMKAERMEMSGMEEKRFFCFVAQFETRKHKKAQIILLVASKNHLKIPFELFKINSSRFLFGRRSSEAPRVESTCSMFRAASFLPSLSAVLIATNAIA